MTDERELARRALADAAAGLRVVAAAARDVDLAAVARQLAERAEDALDELEDE